MSTHRTTIVTLANGLRMLHIHAPGSSAAYAGLAIGAGTRDEVSPSDAGLAHFVEHTIFKGTERRSSWHIINRMEAVGGEINAFTTKDCTVVYTAFPRQATLRAFDLLADLVSHSTFPEKGIDRERRVILDEIHSYLDTPSEAVYDDFEDLLLAGTSSGHNILGNQQTVEAFTPSDCRRWIDTYYKASNMVGWYCGPSAAHVVMRQAESTLAKIPAGGAEISHPSAMADVAPFTTTRQADTHQAHTVAGSNLVVTVNDYAASCQQRSTLALLANILGGPGMNSILNVDLRERRGLVYSVDASATFIGADSGLFAIAWGCDPDDSSTCHRLVEAAVRRIAENGLTPRALAAAKRQYLGQLALARENAAETAISAARATLTFGRAMTMSEARMHIEAINNDALARAAAEILPLSSLTLAP